MKNINELHKRMDKNRILAREFLKSSDIDLSGTKEELLAKTEGIILKTKILIKNTNPNADDNAIADMFKIVEEPILIFKQLEEKGYDTLQLIKDNYLIAAMLYKCNEGLCERVKNRRIEDSNKLLGDFLVQIGEKQINPDINNFFNATEHSKIQKSELKLSPRQREVLQLWSEGYKTRDEISVKIGIKPTTIRRHEEGIFKNLGAGTIEQAIKIAVKNNLII